MRSFGSSVQEPKTVDASRGTEAILAKSPPRLHEVVGAKAVAAAETSTGSLVTSSPLTRNGRVEAIVAAALGLAEALTVRVEEAAALDVAEGEGDVDAPAPDAAPREQAARTAAPPAPAIPRSAARRRMPTCSELVAMSVLAVMRCTGLCRRDHPS